MLKCAKFIRWALRVGLDIFMSAKHFRCPCVLCQLGTRAFCPPQTKQCVCRVGRSHKCEIAGAADVWFGRPFRVVDGPSAIYGRVPRLVLAFDLCKSGAYRGWLILSYVRSFVAHMYTQNTTHHMRSLACNEVGLRYTTYIF